MTNDKIQITNESLILENANKNYDIKERAFKFAARVACFVNALPKEQIYFEYFKQLIRASSSIGANIEEADGTLSKKDFINKIGIGRRESRESRYWLRLIREIISIRDSGLREECDMLIVEAKELLLILSSIINKTLSKMVR